MTTAHAPTADTDRRDRLLAQADLLLLVCSFLRSPTATDRSQWADAQQALDQMIAVADLDAPELKTSLSEALALALELTPELHSGEYHRLFEGKLLCPPNQTAYVRRDKGAVLADICGFYRAFGFCFRAETAEKPDHVVAELEFCSVLLAMIAAATDDEHGRITSEALEAFADCHLGEWLAWFAARLQAVCQIPFYAAVAQVTMQAWQAIAANHGLRATPSSPMGHPEQTPDDPYECGGAPAVGL